MSVAVSPPSAAAERPQRPRGERRARFAVANSYHSSIPADERHLPRRFLRTDFQARVAAAIRAKGGLTGVSFAPVAVEAETLTAIALIVNITLLKRDGRVRVVSAAPDEDRRRRPHGYSDVELSKMTRMNYWRTQRARLRLSKRAGGLIVSRQPHRWVEDKRRFEGLPNITELMPRFFEAIGVPWAEVEAEYERSETEQDFKEQLEGQERARQQAEARARRGDDHPLVQTPKSMRTPAARVLDQAHDADGRRIPHTQEERNRLAALQMQVLQSPEWRERPADVRRAQALMLWRMELGPPS